MAALRQDIERSINSGIARADTTTTKAALVQCSQALTRCKTVDDLLYVQDIVIGVKRNAIFESIDSSLDATSKRLQRLSRRGGG